MVYPGHVLIIINSNCFKTGLFDISGIFYATLRLTKAFTLHGILIDIPSSYSVYEVLIVPSLANRWRAMIFIDESKFETAGREVG